MLASAGGVTREDADAIAEEAYEPFAERRRAELEEQGELDALQSLEDEAQRLRKPRAGPPDPERS